MIVSIPNPLLTCLVLTYEASAARYHAGQSSGAGKLVRQVRHGDPRVPVEQHGPDDRV